MRDALSLLDQAVAYCGGELEQDAVASMLGTIDTAHVSVLLGSLADGDAPALMRAIASIDEQVPDYARLLDDLARLLQRVAVYQVVGATDSDDELEDTEIAGFAERIAASDLQLFYQIALIGRRDLDLAPDPKSGVEMTLLRMLAFQPQRGADESQPDIPARSSRPQPADAPGKPKAIEPPKTAAPPEDPQMLADWARVISQLPLSGASKLLAANCAYLHRKGDTVYLELDRRSESLLTRSRQQAIADALTDKVGKRLRVEISLATTAGDTVVAETPMQAEARRSDEKLEAARESLESDPNVKALRDMFGAELNPDSIELIDDKSVGNPIDRKRVDNPRSATRE